MTLKEVLGLISEGQKCLICFSDGIKGTEHDLNTALKDILLSCEVSCIETSVNVLQIHLE